MNELFRFHTMVRVALEDLDAFEVVNNSNYFKYFERCRIAYFKNLGYLGEGSNSLSNIESTVTDNFCAYNNPAVFNDELIILIRVSYIKKVRLQFQYVLEKEDSSVIALGYTNLAWIDINSLKPKAIPSQLIDSIKNFEGDNLGEKIDITLNDYIVQSYELDM